MATESPLLHDGGQNTLSTASDFRNSSVTGSTLAGPNGSGQFLAVQVSTARTISLMSTGGSSGLGIYGICQNKPGPGVAVDVGFLGISKCVAGAAITGGQALMASATLGGTLVPYSTAVLSAWPCGVALETAAAGQVFTANITGILNNFLKSTA